MQEYVGVGDALTAVLARVHPARGSESVGVTDAYGRVAARDVAARANSPAFPRSHMDGFAVNSDDLKAATQDEPVRLRIGSRVHIGRTRREKLRRGEGVRVATGTFMPKGADAVLPVEEVVVRGGNVWVSSPTRTGSFVYQAGADYRKGEILIRRGQRLRAQDIGVLISLGFNRVPVRIRPKVAIIATGSELSDSTRLRRGQVRNSHGPVFEQLVRASGCIPVMMGVVKDEADEVRVKLTGALNKADAVLTLGGTSAGNLDVTGEAVGALNPEVVFHGIRMDRGRVTGVAVVKGKLVLMMPGPIQASMNAFLLFAIPVLHRLAGIERGSLKVTARLGGSWRARERFSDFTKVVYVRLSNADGLTAEPIVGETESFTVLTRSSGYVVLPEGTTQMKKGDLIEVGLIPGFSYAA